MIRADLWVNGDAAAPTTRATACHFFITDLQTGLTARVARRRQRSGDTIDRSLTETQRVIVRHGAKERSSGTKPAALVGFAPAKSGRTVQKGGGGNDHGSYAQELAGPRSLEIDISHGQPAQAGLRAGVRTSLRSDTLSFFGALPECMAGADPRRQRTKVKTYRAGWTIVCSLLAIVGSSVAFVSSPIALVFLWIIFGGSVSLVTIALCGPQEVRASYVRCRLALTGALAGGAGASAFLGFAVILNAGVLLLALLALASSPFAISVFRRWWGSAAAPSTAQLEALIGVFAYASPEYLAIQCLPQFAALTDTQLCQRWRASYLNLQGQPSEAEAMALVRERHGYLDELERRNPSGFAAWLASGAWASSNPLPYLVKDRTDTSPINWDDVFRGQD
jgi:hypothetical protein